MFCYFQYKHRGLIDKLQCLAMTALVSGRQQAPKCLADVWGGGCRFDRCVMAAGHCWGRGGGGGGHKVTSPPPLTALKSVTEAFELLLNVLP